MIHRTQLLGIGVLALLAASCGGEVLPEVFGSFGSDAGGGGSHVVTDAGRGGSSSSSRGGGGGGDSGIIVFAPDSSVSPPSFDSGKIGPADAVVSHPPPPFDGGVGPDDGGIISFPPPPFDGGVRPEDSGVVSPPPFRDGGITLPDSGVKMPDGGVIIFPFDGGIMRPDGDIIMPIDASPPVDAGADSGPVSTTIPCGASTCNLDTQQCCVSFSGSASCAAIGDCQGASLSCGGSANCTGGQVCCADLGLGGVSATCEDTCGGGGLGGIGGGLQLCSSASDCPAGDTCRDTPLGVSVCTPGGFGGGGGGFGGGGGTGGAPGLP